MTLSLALRAVAAGVAVAGSIEYLVQGEFVPAPFGVAIVLVVLSFAEARFRRPVAIATTILCVVIPIGAIAGWLAGALAIAVPLFDSVIFGWLASIAWPVARALSGATSAG
jgi:hypothetical protein